MTKLKRVLLPALTIAVLLVLWQIVVVLNIVPNYLVPSPYQVFLALMRDAALLASHTLVTLEESLLGLAIGVVIGFVIAVLMDRFEGLYHAFSPLITVSQTIPVVAIAPLLVLWMGYGILPKIMLILLTSFFPITIGLLDGFRSVDKDMLNLLKTMGASSFQNFIHLKLPSSLGYFFAGLRISVSYSIIGAVVAEWLGGYDGLGVYMTRVRKSYSFDKMFAVIFLISAISLLLMYLVKKIQKWCMVWEK